MAIVSQFTEFLKGEDTFPLTQAIPWKSLVGDGTVLWTHFTAAQQPP